MPIPQARSWRSCATPARPGARSRLEGTDTTDRRRALPLPGAARPLASTHRALPRVLARSRAVGRGGRPAYDVRAGVRLRVTPTAHDGSRGRDRVQPASCSAGRVATACRSRSTPSTGMAAGACRSRCSLRIARGGSASSYRFLRTFAPFTYRFVARGRGADGISLRRRDVASRHRPDRPVMTRSTTRMFTTLRVAGRVRQVRLAPDAGADRIGARPSAEAVRAPASGLASRSRVGERPPASALLPLEHDHEAALRLGHATRKRTVPGAGQPRRDARIELLARTSDVHRAYCGKRVVPPGVGERQLAGSYRQPTRSANRPRVGGCCHDSCVGTAATGGRREVTLDGARRQRAGRPRASALPRNVTRSTVADP